MAKEKREKKKKKHPEEVVLTPEEVFVQLNTLKNATRCILRIEDEYMVYARLAKDFAELGAKAAEEPFEGYEQCATLSEECREKAEALKPRLPVAREEDSRTVTTTMREKEQREGQKKGRGKWCVLAVLLFGTVLAFCYKAAPTRYLIAELEKGLSLEKYAMESYDSLGDYRDSREQTREMMYQYASELQKEGRLGEAREFFQHLAESNFSDSGSRTLLVEKKMIAEARVGERVYFGTHAWILLDRKDGRALLARDQAIRGKAAGDVPIAGEVYETTESEVTWEESSLRAYLNHDFIKEEFSTEELGVIEDTHLSHADNKAYGTKGGRDTVDKVYILSAEEIENFSGILKNKAKNLRLRNPGMGQDSTAYCSSLGEVVYYGFPINQKGVYNRPVLWMRYEDVK